MFSNNVELDRLGDTRSFLFRGTELQKELGEGWGCALAVQFQTSALSFSMRGVVVVQKHT